MSITQHVPEQQLTEPTTSEPVPTVIHPTPEREAEIRAHVDEVCRDMERRRAEADAAKKSWTPARDPQAFLTDPANSGRIMYRTDGGTPIPFPIPAGTNAIADGFRAVCDGMQGVTDKLDADVAAVRSNSDLSDEGKQRRITQLREDALRAVGVLAVNLRRHDAVVGEQLSEALPFVANYRDHDTATPAIDMRLLDRFNSLTGTERAMAIAVLLNGDNPRLADALMRMPPELVSLPGPTFAQLREGATARTNPREVARRAELGQASRAANLLAARTAARIALDGRITYADQRELLGDAASLFGIQPAPEANDG